MAGVDRSQLDNTIPDVLEMYNLTEQRNVSPYPAHYRGKKGMAGWGGGGREQDEQFPEPSCEPGKNGWNITFALIMTVFHRYSHIPLVLFFPKRKYQICYSVHKKS